MVEVYACLAVPLLVVTVILAVLALSKSRSANKRLDKEAEALNTRITTLTNRVAWLEGRGGEVVSAAQREGEAVARAAPAIAPAHTPPVTEPDTAKEPAAQPVIPRAAPQPVAVAATTPVQGSTSRPAPVTEPKPQQTSPPAYERMAADLRENPVVSWFTGTHIVVRVGIVVLFFGVAFLLKFAADQGWLSIELRLAGAALLGLVLVGFGWRQRRSEGRRVYALTLQGGGLGILYMTTFTAFRVYELLPGSLAFGLLVVVSAATVALAVVNDSRSLAIFAVAGGFAAPFLVSTGEGSHIMLFSYIAVINAVILAVAWFKSWRELNLVGFAFTVAVGVLWGTQAYTPSLFWSTEAFLILFFLFYAAITVLHAYRRPTQLADPVDGILVFGTPLVTATFQTAMLRDVDLAGGEPMMAWSSLALGVFYLLSGALLWRTVTLNFGTLGQVFLGLGALFVTLAVPFAFDDHVTAAVWAAGGAGLLWLGVRYGKRYYRVLGGLTQLGAGWAMAVYLIDQSGGAASAVDGFTFVGPVIALAGLFSGYWLFSARAMHITERRLGEYALAVWGLIWWFAWGVWQLVTWSNLPAARFPASLLADGRLDYALLIFFVLSVAVGEWIGGRLRWSLVRFPALLLPIPAAMVVMTQLASYDHLLANGGWLAWPLTLGVYYWTLYRRDGDSWQSLYHAGGLWGLAFLGAVEGGYLAGELSSSDDLWIAIGVIIAPLLLVLGVSLLGRRIPWPTARHYATYMMLGSGPLVGILLLWVVGTTFANDGGSSLPYVAVLNPLSLAQLAVLAVTLVWLRRLEVARDMRIAGYAVLAGFAFLWLTVEMARIAHHYTGVAYEFDALFGSELLQTSYSIVWTGLALVLMFAAKQRKARWAWLIGAGLLGVTVLKLFLVDLSNTGTLARIVSFLVVGVLMLIIGYLAPIPPRKQEPAVVSQPEAAHEM